LNKTQLKIKKIILLDQTQFNTFLVLNQTNFIIHRRKWMNSGAMLQCSREHGSTVRRKCGWSHAPLFIHFLITRSSRELLLVSCTTVNDETHHWKIVMEILPNRKNYGCGWTSLATISPETTISNSHLKFSAPISTWPDSVLFSY